MPPLQEVQQSDDVLALAFVKASVRDYYLLLTLTWNVENGFVAQRKVPQ